MLWMEVTWHSEVELEPGLLPAGRIPLGANQYADLNNQRSPKPGDFGLRGVRHPTEMPGETVGEDAAESEMLWRLGV